MAVIELSNFRNHNREVTKGGIGKENPNDIRDTLEKKLLPEFCQGIQNIRAGKIVDSKGIQQRPRDISLEVALREKLGFGSLKQFLGAFDCHMGTNSLNDFAVKLGVNSLSKATMEQFLIEHSEFANPFSTKDIDSTFRFIIPEIFTNAIRLGYEHAQQHQNWIAKTINMPQRTLTMPLILRGDGMPSKVNEGANIPVGSIKFGRKDVKIFKIGTGFDITDELLMDSQLDLLYIFMGEVGNDMAIGADSHAIYTLINGEQADGSESAPVVGVIATGDGFTYKDVKKVFTRMKRMNQPATRMITGEDDAINITGIDRFEGFQGVTKLASVQSIVGVPEKFENDVYVMPANQIMYLCPTKAMVRLQYRGMMIERRRNPQNQTEEMYVSDWINFAIIKRDARVIQTKASTIGSAPFPSYMDIDTRISASYQQL